MSDPRGIMSPPPVGGNRVEGPSAVQRVNRRKRHSEEENERRFQECMRIINNMKPGEIEKLMGKEFMEEFRRVSQ